MSEGRIACLNVNHLMYEIFFHLFSRLNLRLTRIKILTLRRVVYMIEKHLMIIL